MQWQTLVILCQREFKVKVLRKCIDVVFKYRFRELKFDVQHDVKGHKVAGPVDD
ncbi:hypothetical protein D8674_030948 [Pyrus ussuriensis x Pyrus communis]|uniref:Uncharacterized protein n=1 Tax=Pyrus ussuriensis x Pyrus communis TaxID=2448454 RepID=A0A5N5EX24_9ROSA|nr:hypothetical protein D8674_030948 [Pyrus ussuriensis x Pyrus communis]